MKVGVSQVEITPPVGVELCGYAARTQPSVGVLDPLFAKAIYIESSDGNKFLWVVADLLAISREMVMDFRKWAGEVLGLGSEQVMISATHTHSGPASILLTAAGECDAGYMRRLPSFLQQAARQAIAGMQPCDLVTAEADLDIAVDRRGKPTGQTDPHALGLGFRRSDGTFIAAMLNYAMHPVTLGHVNRRISADWCGYAAEALGGSLSGHPVALVTNGAAGNLNPPGEGWSVDQVRDLGRQVADAVVNLATASSVSNASLRAESRIVPMSMDVLTPEQIERVASREIAKIAADHPWFKPIRHAVDNWRKSMKEMTARGGGKTVDIEIHAVSMGPITLVGVNCEMFAHFTQALRTRLRNPHVHVVGYTNGAFGYVAHDAAYDEGGYEVESAHFFYNSFRPRRGSLELLCQQAVSLIQSMP